MIYGSTGYTGRLITERAVEAGLTPILAGRNPDPLREQAERFGLPWRAYRLDRIDDVTEALSDTDVMINAAGPFLETASPMIDACLSARVHYLDISGELPAFEGALRRDQEAAEAGVMLMPGAAWSVVATDCLAAHVVANLPSAKYLRIGIAQSNIASRGSARSALGLFSSQVVIRRNGYLTTVPVGRVERSFDYGDGARPSTALSWPDVLCAYRSTGVPNIEVYMDVGALPRVVAPFSSRIGELFQLPRLQPVLRATARILPSGPEDDVRKAARQVIVAEAEDSWRRVTSARLTTPDGYDFTAEACVAIAGRLLEGEYRPGFQTPAGLYGADFVLGLEGTHRDDIWTSPERQAARTSRASAY